MMACKHLSLSGMILNLAGGRVAMDRAVGVSKLNENTTRFLDPHLSKVGTEGNEQ